MMAFTRPMVHTPRAASPFWALILLLPSENHTLVTFLKSDRKKERFCSGVPPVIDQRFFIQCWQTPEDEGARGQRKMPLCWVAQRTGVTSQHFSLTLVLYVFLTSEAGNEARKSGDASEVKNMGLFNWFVTEVAQQSCTNDVTPFFVNTRVGEDAVRGSTTQRAAKNSY